MIRAYDEILLPGAMDSLGRMLDYSVHSLHIDPEAMIGLFAASNAAADFARGDIRLIAGMSGIELAFEVLDLSGIPYERITARHTSSPSSEYRCGGALAYAQWKTALSFERIISLISVKDLISGFSKRKAEALEKLPPDSGEDARSELLSALARDFTEETAEKLVSTLRSRALSSDPPLKILRIKNGLSQRELAEASDVPLRTIQQYEQRQKDLNRARSEYLVALSSALNCRPEELMELFR